MPSLRGMHGTDPYARSRLVHSLDSWHVSLLATPDWTCQAYERSEDPKTKSGPQVKHWM